MKNQKRIISVALTALLLAGLGGTVAAAEGMKTASAAKIASSVNVASAKEDQAEKTDTKKEEKKQEAKTEEKADQEKDKKSEEVDSKASAAASTETVKEKAASTGASSSSGSSSQGTSGNSAASNSGSGSGSASSGNTQVSQPVQPTQPAEPAQPSQPAEPAQPAQPAEPAQPSQPVHEHNWQPQYTTEKKWVVDQEAWTETVSVPVYEQRIVWYCNTCNEDITEDPEEHVDVTMHSGYRNDYVSVQVDTKTEEISHPEEGHYEPYDVLTGYTCSCGATK